MDSLQFSASLGALQKHCVLILFVRAIQFILVMSFPVAGEHEWTLIIILICPDIYTSSLIEQCISVNIRS